MTPKPFGDSSPAAIAVVKAVSFLDPNSIKKDMLATNKHLFSDYPIGMDMLMTALRELETSEFFSPSTNETFSINANVPENVRNMLDNTEWTSIFRGVVSLLSASWPFTEFKTVISLLGGLPTKPTSRTAPSCETCCRRNGGSKNSTLVSKQRSSSTTQLGESPA